jgi:phenylpropionate dioxygenase-like ring-hydroxylating dioxygenase large terminal subunit
MGSMTVDPILNDWHPVAALKDLPEGHMLNTVLLGKPISVRRQDSRYKTLERFGHLWVCLGEPQRDLFAIPEAAEPDRRHLTGGKMRIQVSGLRFVENFLDIGHFPYVHTGLLGAQESTEVREYRVRITPEDELVATNCVFYQPKASLTAEKGFDVGYTYRVPRPYCAILYKSNAKHPSRQDVLAQFLQPVTEEECISHPYRCLLDDEHSDAEILRFQQSIFAQDKPIVESQLPKRLPLDLRAERHVRSDASSSLYRRWLRVKGVRFGTA